MGYYGIIGANFNLTDCNPFQLLGYSGTFNPAYLICIEKGCNTCFFNGLQICQNFCKQNILHQTARSMNVIVRGVYSNITE